MSLFSRQDYKDGASFVTYAFWIIALIVVFSGALFLLTRPAAVVNKTLDTNNIITKYEWFYDTSNAINSRVAQIKSHKTLRDAEQAGAEKSRLSIELAGMQQSCRDMVASYNANAAKANVSIFKTDTTPSSFSLSICE